MKSTTQRILMLVAALGCAPVALAQSGAVSAIPHSASAVPGAASGMSSESRGSTGSSGSPAAAPQVQRAGGVEYVSGGVGEESRAALQSMQTAFALRLVFSAQGGEYFVADKVTLRNAGGEVASMSGVGPILMLKLKPGDYTVTADYSGRTEQRKIKVGSAAQTVNWRW